MTRPAPKSLRWRKLTHRLLHEYKSQKCYYTMVYDKVT